jgi:hypothetical protein
MDGRGKVCGASKTAGATRWQQEQKTGNQIVVLWIDC